MKFRSLAIRKRYLLIAGLQFAVVAAVVSIFIYDGPATYNSCEELADELVGHDLLRGNLRLTKGYDSVSVQAPISEFQKRVPDPDSPNRITAVQNIRDLKTRSGTRGRAKPNCRAEVVVSGIPHWMDFYVRRDNWGPERLQIHPSPPSIRNQARTKGPSG